MRAISFDRLELLIFDLDGVLVDTSDCHERAYGDLWSSMGIRGPAYASIAGRRTRDAVTETTARLNPTVRDIRTWSEFKQERARHYLDAACVSYPDTILALQRLVSRGHRLALATGASRTTATRLLTRLSLESFFLVVVTGDDVASGKPSPDVFTSALSALQVSADAALVIEDSPSGLEAAFAAGARFVSVRSGAIHRSDRFLGQFPDLDRLTQALGCP